MNERFASDRQPTSPLTLGALSVDAVVAVAVSPIAVAIAITSIVIIRPSAGGASD